LKIFYLTI